MGLMGRREEGGEINLKETNDLNSREIKVKDKVLHTAAENMRWRLLNV